jgi:hypothetical protein
VGRPREVPDCGVALHDCDRGCRCRHGCARW